MTEVVETPLENQNPAIVVDQKPLPKILLQKIEQGNRQLNQLQREIQSDIESATLELMELMGISRDDGWYLDLDGMRFVKLGQEDPSLEDVEEDPIEE